MKYSIYETIDFKEDFSNNSKRIRARFLPNAKKFNTTEEALVNIISLFPLMKRNNDIFISETPGSYDHKKGVFVRTIRVQQISPM